MYLLLPLFSGCTDYNVSYQPDEDKGGGDSGRPYDPRDGEDTAITDDSGDSGDEVPEGDGYIPADEPSTEDPIGSVCTILLTLSDDWIAQSTASTLIENAVRNVTSEKKPKVLVIKDDATGGEDDGDPQFITDLLNAVGFPTDLVDEPSGGITRDMLTGYHVAILSNPGHPPDDHATIAAMRDFSTQGYGILFQGDDMTRFDDDSDAMEELTRLRNIDNGETYYGWPVDNDGWITYTVTIDAGSPLAKGMSDRSFEYGNDIDTSEAIDTNSVEATATITDSDLPEKPAITLYTP